MGLGVESSRVESAGLLVFEGGEGIKEGGECGQVKRERERLVVRDFRGKTEQ